MDCTKYRTRRLLYFGAGIEIEGNRSMEEQDSMLTRTDCASVRGFTVVLLAQRVVKAAPIYEHD